MFLFRTNVRYQYNVGAKEEEQDTSLRPGGTTDVLLGDWDLENPLAYRYEDIPAVESSHE